jgi:hypothetical protein
MLVGLLLLPAVLKCEACISSAPPAAMEDVASSLRPLEGSCDTLGSCAPCMCSTAAGVAAHSHEAVQCGSTQCALTFWTAQASSSSILRRYRASASSRVINILAFWLAGIVARNANNHIQISRARRYTCETMGNL